MFTNVGVCPDGMSGRWGLCSDTRPLSLSGISDYVAHAHAGLLNLIFFVLHILYTYDYSIQTQEDQINCWSWSHCSSVSSVQCLTCHVTYYSFVLYYINPFFTAQVLYPGYRGQRPEKKGQKNPRGADHVHLQPQVTPLQMYH